MTNDPLGSLPILAVVYVAILSVPVAILTVTLSEFTDSMANSLGFVVGGIAGVTGVGLLAAALVMGPTFAGVILATLLAGGLVLGVVPVGLGWVVLGRLGGAGGDAALRDALAGWPVGLAVSVATLSSPDWSGFDYRAATGSVPELVFGLAVLAGVLGPTVVGLLIVTLRSRGREGDGED